MFAHFNLNACNIYCDKRGSDYIVSYASSGEILISSLGVQDDNNNDKE